MPKNLDNLTPIQAAYRASSYLSDYGNIVAEALGEEVALQSDLVRCILQSAYQMALIAKMFEAMQRRGGPMPPLQN